MKTLEKLSVGGDLTGESFLTLVSVDDGVPEWRLLEFCSSNDFSDDERSTPNGREKIISFVPCPSEIPESLSFSSSPAVFLRFLIVGNFFGNGGGCLPAAGVTIAFRLGL